MHRRRRDVLLGGTAPVAAAGSLPAPAISQGIRELKMVTDWPEVWPGWTPAPSGWRRSITALSDGRLKVTVYPSGSLVRALETFDAVAAGVADMYHSFDPYFEGKSVQQGGQPSGGL